MVTMLDIQNAWQQVSNFNNPTQIYINTLAQYTGSGGVISRERQNLTYTMRYHHFKWDALSS
jgi:hypothetical protein